MVPADSRRIPRAPRYSGAPCASSGFAYGSFTLFGRPFQVLPLAFGVQSPASYYPAGASPRPRFGLLPVRSPLLGESLSYFLFLRVLRCFSSPGWPRAQGAVHGFRPCGLSHSDIRASKVICTYARLFAAYRVLLRLDEPRHPPSALSYFPLCGNSLRSSAACILSAPSGAAALHRLSCKGLTTLLFQV
jgi:hypothetical protein